MFISHQRSVFEFLASDNMFNSLHIRSQMIFGCFQSSSQSIKRKSTVYHDAQKSDIYKIGCRSCLFVQAMLKSSEKCRSSLLRTDFAVLKIL